MKWPRWFHRGPGHLGKGKLLEQTRFEWKFVSLVKIRRGWQVTAYSEPGHPRRAGDGFTINLSLLSTMDAINYAAELNRQKAEGYVRRQRRKRQKEHQDSIERGEQIHRNGPVSQCPVCQEARGRRRK